MLFGYPQKAGIHGEEGQVLVRPLIGTKGIIGEYKILKGPNSTLVGNVTQYFEKRKNLDPLYSAARVNKKKVTFEKILSFNFGIDWFCGLS